MDIISIFLISIIVVLAVYIAYQDITTRKITNLSMIIFFLLSVLFFILSHPHTLIIYLLFTLLTLISFLLYSTNIWGAADGKFFIASSLIVLSFNEILHFFEYLFNMIFVFAIGSLCIGLIRMKPHKQYALVKAIPIKLFLFQSLIILAITTPLYRMLQIYIPLFIIQIIITIIIILIINYGAKKLFYKLNENEIIVLGFIGFASSFYQLLHYFPYAFISLLIIKSLMFYANQVSMKGMDTKKYGFAPPIVSYMATALLIQLLIQQTLILYIVNLF